MYGVFGYSVDDIITWCTYYGTKEEAIAFAVELATELNGEDLFYIEVWQADNDGLFGNCGQPVWRQELNCDVEIN